MRSPTSCCVLCWCFGMCVCVRVCWMVSRWCWDRCVHHQTAKEPYTTYHTTQNTTHNYNHLTYPRQLRRRALGCLVVQVPCVCTMCWLMGERAPDGSIQLPNLMALVPNPSIVMDPVPASATPSLSPSETTNARRKMGSIHRACPFVICHVRERLGRMHMAEDRPINRSISRDGAHDDRAYLIDQVAAHSHHRLQVGRRAAAVVGVNVRMCHLISRVGMDPGLYTN